MDLIEFLFDLVTSVLWSGRRKSSPRDVNQRAPSNASTPEKIDRTAGPIHPPRRVRPRLWSKMGKNGKPVGDDGRARHAATDIYWLW